MQSKINKAKLNKEEVKDVYTSISKIYDIWANLTESSAREIVLQSVKIPDKSSVLEVAVGTGILFQEILKQNPNGKNEGIDLTEAMLNKARIKAKKTGIENYNLQVGDAYKLPFKENQFDFLFNNYMFDLMPEEDFPVILSEFKRVLKKDGQLILVNMTKGDGPLNNVWETVYKINPKLMGGCRGVMLESPLTSVGFTLVSRKTISQFGFPSEIVIAKK